MSKEIFLASLEQMLYDIPKDEREAAMDYYRAYFADAGAENEALVLEELGSPQKVAAGIKEGLDSQGDVAHLQNPLQVREDTGEAESGQYRYGREAGSYRRYNESSQSAQGAPFTKYAQYKESYEKSESRADSPNGEADGEKKRGSRWDMDKRSKWICLIIVAVFLTAPLWGSVASCLIGACGVLVAAVVLLAVFSVGGVIGGIICTVFGIVRLCMLSVVSGLIGLGVGMLLLAGGGISFVLLLLLCGRFFPWAVRNAADLAHRLLNWGRSLA